MPDGNTPGQTSLPPHDEPTTIRAMTIHPPWSDLIALEDEAIAKRIENRSWNWFMDRSVARHGS